MIRRMLVALDASPFAPAVIDAAAEIAQRFNAAIIPLRVIDVGQEFPAAGAGTERDRLPEHLSHVAAEELATLTARQPSAYVTTPLIVAGQPWRVILAQSEAHDVDLIVLGSHGFHGIDRLLGTTAGRVANLAKRNVFVVHAHRAEVGS